MGYYYVCILCVLYIFYYTYVYNILYFNSSCNEKRLKAHIKLPEPDVVDYYTLVTMAVQ